jgi:hypothetical protein
MPALFNISETFDAKSTCTIVVFPMLVLGDSLVDTRRIERAGQIYLSKFLTLPTFRCLLVSKYFLFETIGDRNVVRSVLKFRLTIPRHSAV